MSTQIEIRTDAIKLAIAPAIAREEAYLKPFRDSEKRENERKLKELQEYMALSWLPKLFAVSPNSISRNYFPPFRPSGYALERLTALSRVIELHEGHTILIGVEDAHLLFPKESK